MKRLFPLIIVFAIFLSSCGLGNAQPTAITLPTALPSQVGAGSQSSQAGQTRTNSKDGMVQVFVPSGSFRMGGVDADAQSDEKPAHNVSMSSFWIDKVEVTNSMYQLCVQANACDAPRDFKSATRPSYFGNAQFNDYPVIYVNWQDAFNFCKWVGGRLPTEAEWEYAARGSADYRRFPWGDQSPDNSLANYDFTQRDTTRVGSFPTGASPFGALDMAGNVWEWVNDFYSPTYYGNAPSQNPQGPTAGVNGPRKVIRGGSWADPYKELRVSNRGYALAPDLTADSKSAAYMGEANDKIGFRCAADN